MAASNLPRQGTTAAVTPVPEREALEDRVGAAGSTLQVGELRDSTNIYGHHAELLARLREDGYVLLRNFHDRDAVLAGREALLGRLVDAGAVRGGPGEPGVVSPERWPQAMAAGGDLSGLGELREVVAGRRVMAFFDALFGERAITYDYVWLRTMGPGAASLPHCDAVFMGRGTTGSLFTRWTPSGDIPVELGTLALCLDSGYQERRSPADRPLRVETCRRGAPPDQAGTLGPALATPERRGRRGWVPGGATSQAAPIPFDPA